MPGVIGTNRHDIVLELTGPAKRSDDETALLSSERYAVNGCWMTIATLTISLNITSSMSDWQFLYRH